MWSSDVGVLAVGKPPSVNQKKICSEECPQIELAEVKKIAGGFL